MIAEQRAGVGSDPGIEMIGARDDVPDLLGALPELRARVEKSLFIFAAFFASLAGARADLVMEQQSRDATATNHITFKLHGDKMRMDQQADKGTGFSVIIDLNTRDSITLMPREKMFLKRSGAEKTASRGTNEMDQAPARPVNIGKTGKVGGYETEIYSWSGAQGVTETLWVATNFPSYISIRTELARIDRFDAAGSHKNAQPELSLLPGMVVRTERMVKGQTTTITLVSAKVEPVDPSLFELPADYSPRKPPASPQKTNSTMAPNR